MLPRAAFLEGFKLTKRKGDRGASPTSHQLGAAQEIRMVRIDDHKADGSGTKNYFGGYFNIDVNVKMDLLYIHIQRRPINLWICAVGSWKAATLINYYIHM